jgi:GT2 family glycosyltransferase
MSEGFLDLSVIIPFKDHSDLTIACINSLESFAGKIKEVLLVSNNSSPKELHEVTQIAQSFNNTKVVEYNHPFNFQKINNWAAKQSSGKVLLFLNNDVELLPVSKKLIEEMYRTALLPDVGAVGCVLLYEDLKTIQHAGVYLVPGGTADHLYIGKKLLSVFRKIDSKEYYYDIRKSIVVSAVTAAAVMVTKQNFNSVSGFNEAFIVCGGDVDLCLRLTKAGKKTVLVGSDYGYMIHKESRSRSSMNIPYIDFVESYRSYITYFNTAKGDPNLDWDKIPHE